jgi:hypothetical protein
MGLKKMKMKMKMKTFACFACLVVGVLISSLASAYPTGAPLFSFPVEPCRVLDTRVNLGALPGGTAMDVHVRGSNLLASEGAARTDCGIPPEAEAVVLNVTVIQSTTGGYLKINSYGTVSGVNGPYSRLTFRPLENDSTEIQVGLCNTYLYPAPHQPCGFNGSTYDDIQILNMAPSGSSLHIVADVVGYLAR